MDENTNQGSDVLLNLEGLVKNHITGVDRIKTQIKKHREMLDDILTNDTTYKLHEEKSKEAAKLKSKTKAQILQQPQAYDLSVKLKNMKTELKEMEGALSDYLKEYARLSGANEIEGEDGEVREIVYVAKLVKKSAGLASKE